MGDIDLHGEMAMGLQLQFEKKAKVKLLWFVIFAVIFGLSLDIWNWNQSDVVLFGFSFWIVRIIGLTVLLFPLFFIFVNNVWRE